MKRLDSNGLSAVVGMGRRSKTSSGARRGRGRRRCLHGLPRRATFCRPATMTCSPPESPCVTMKFWPSCCPRASPFAGALCCRRRPPGHSFQIDRSARQRLAPPAGFPASHGEHRHSRRSPATIALRVREIRIDIEGSGLGVDLIAEKGDLAGLVIGRAVRQRQVEDEADVYLLAFVPVLCCMLTTALSLTAKTTRIGSS